MAALGMELHLRIGNIVSLILIGGQLVLVILLTDGSGLGFEIVIGFGILILNDGNFHTGFFVFCPGFEYNAAGFPVLLKLFRSDSELRKEIGMGGQVLRGQDNIDILIQGHLAGNVSQGIFRISHGAGTENHHEKDQNE